MPDVRMQVGADAGVPDVVRRRSRLRALGALEANAVSAADALDRIAGLACRMLETPVAIVNLVGAETQRFVGCDAPEEWAGTREMPITYGFCPFALGAEHAFTVTDARADPELAANPVVAELGVVAYAGVPVRAAAGEPVGTLCTIDNEPREWSADDVEVLTNLAGSAVAELQLLAATRQAARQQARLRSLSQLSGALAPARGPEEMLGELAHAAGRVDGSGVCLLVLDGSEQVLHATGAAAVTPVEAKLPLAELARTGRAEFLPTRAAIHKRLAPLLDVVPDVGSIALLPLTAGERLLGALGVCFADERELSSDDLDYLEALAGVTGLALTRAG
jgi:GAF domain-containing protein